MRRALLTAACCLWLAGCDDDPTAPTVSVPPEAGPDAETPADAAPPDSGQEPDVRHPNDAIPPDGATPPDGGDTDGAAPPDAAVGDTACSNRVDDDDDGRVDYPADPGCDSAADDDEADPEQPACNDGVDNDGDDRPDWPRDPGCYAEEDPSEASACGALSHDIQDVSGLGLVEGSTVGAPAELAACRNNLAPERVFLFTLRESVDRLHFDTIGSRFDTLLGVYRACPDGAEPTACNDDLEGGGKQSAVDIDLPALGDYYVVVDGFLEEQGEFQLHVRAELADGRPCPEGDGPVVCSPGAVCRDGVCARAQCNDGRDNDQDGRIDFPDEPGCDAPADDDEADPEVAPECSDGQDNDNNGSIDYPVDPWCDSAADDEERRPPQCRDGQDNDFDGLVDLADPGCEGDPDRENEFNIEACRDGRDNDDDGLIDYPNDPGCELPRDLYEDDPDPLPACANGIDDDGDGDTDFPDDADGCTYAADPTEADPCADLEPTEITGLENPRGNTEGRGNEFSASCAPQTGPDEVLLWRVAEDRPLQGMVISSRGTRFDTVISVRDRCDAPLDAELACDNDSGPSSTSVVRLGPQPAGTELWIVVDGDRGDSGGIWRLSIVALLAEGANCDGAGYRCGEGLTCAGDVDDGRRCVVAECANEADDDEDGLADWPEDPGCGEPGDDDEADPGEAPECANGLDDDGDGRVDWPEDPSCLGAGDPS